MLSLSIARVTKLDGYARQLILKQSLGVKFYLTTAGFQAAIEQHGFAGPHNVALSLWKQSGFGFLVDSTKTYPDLVAQRPG